MAAVDQETFEYLLPLAYQWAKAQEEFVLAHGNPLGPRHAHDAVLAGVQDCARVRVLVVDRFPVPEDPDLAEAARRIGIITEDTRCMGFGHALIIRVDAWNDRELAQWVRQYLSDRARCPDFTLGSVEEEARRTAREICSAHAVA
jgi:hypothetical protein